MDIFEQVLAAVSECTKVKDDDAVLLNGHLIPIKREGFCVLNGSVRSLPAVSGCRVAFVDGGQAEIIGATNISLQFMRAYAGVFDGSKRIGQELREFYLLVRAEQGNDISYKAQIFPVRGAALLQDNILYDSMDETLRSGTERAEVSRVASAVRRFAELALAREMQEKSEHVVIDGTLEPTFTGEEAYLSRLGERVAALAKTARVFTMHGKPAATVVGALAPEGVWEYPLLSEGRRHISFVKLHNASEHVFRFETYGDKRVLPALVSGSTDPAFFGYPYGLVWADKCARVSHHESEAMRTRFMIRLGKNVKGFLSTVNAHELLDGIFYGGGRG